MQAISLLRGQLLGEHSGLPLTLRVQLDDVRPRFIPKCQVGGGYRAIARSGRVLLASDRALTDLIGQDLRLRIGIWHRAILTGDRPEPYGLLLIVRAAVGPMNEPLFSGRLMAGHVDSADLALDVGGGQSLVFFRIAAQHSQIRVVDCKLRPPNVEPSPRQTSDDSAVQ
jgi:hypothetical protein